MSVFLNMQYHYLHSGYEYKIWQPGTEALPGKRN